MMRFLLDSHVFLWYDSGDPSLRAAHRARLDDSENQLFLSVASIWELTIKRSLGKLTSAGNFRQTAEALRIDLLPIRAEHAEMVGTLPRLHSDPFDHMLLAQAMVEGLVLATHDAALSAYDVSILRV